MGVAGTAAQAWHDEISGRENALAVDFNVPRGELVALQQARRELTADAVDIWQALAVGVVAPVLAGFVHWIAAQAAMQENSVLCGVMREGRLLCRMLQRLHGVAAQEIWVNRHCAMLAAFGSGDDTALVNWLARTRVQPLTRAAAAELLQAPVPGDPASVLDADAAQALVTENPGKWLAAARAPAAALAARLLRHWRGIVPPGRPVLLLDFACAGNIQRALQAVLAAAGDGAKLVGTNFLMTSGSVWAERAGCVQHGFLAARGAPAVIAAPYARTPELIEIFAAAPIGPLLGYAADGTPQGAPTFLTPEQVQRIDRLQGQIIAAAEAYQRALFAPPSAALARCLLGRLLTQPTLAEVATLADWPIDGGMDGAAARPLAPPVVGNLALGSRAETAWPVGSKLRASAA
ncbi:MAG: hypothetical protein WBK91_02225 [Alphaproteobacteria bacterium]